MRGSVAWHGSRRWRLGVVLRWGRFIDPTMEENVRENAKNSTTCKSSAGQRPRNFWRLPVSRAMSSVLAMKGRNVGVSSARGMAVSKNARLF